MQSEQITTISNSNNGIGNTGNIEITAQNISFFNGGSIFSFSNGQGDIGNITLTATDDITFDGTGLNRSGIRNSFNNPEATGNLGNISLSAQNLLISNGGQISSIVAGIADSGNINLEIDNSIDIQGFGIVGSNTFVSEISSQVLESGVGDSGDININTKNLSITQNGQINASIAGLGNGGDIDINASTIAIDAASIASVTLSGLTSSAGLEANAGNISIDTNSLLLNNLGRIDVGVIGIGNGGSITINAIASVEANNGRIVADISNNAEGNGGNLQINTNRLSLTDGTFISANVLGIGDAGNITINATDLVEIVDSTIQADIDFLGQGNGGSLQIDTARLSLTNETFITANVVGTGDAGDININAVDLIEIADSRVQVNVLSNVQGNGGNLQIDTTRLSVGAGAFVESNVFGIGNAGDITINATESIAAFETAFISAGIGRDGQGNGGNLTIDTTRLSVADEAILSTTLGISGEGNAGDININAIDSITLSEDARITANTLSDSTGNGGNLTIETKILTTKDTGRISATTFGNGNAGSVTIKASDSITLSGASETTRSGLFASALSSGNGGDLSVFTDELTISNGATISVSNFQSRGLREPGTGEAGNLEIEANSISLANDALIIAATESGVGGNITLKADSIYIANQSDIVSQTDLSARGSDIQIKATELIEISNINSSISSLTGGSGNSGNITINTPELRILDSGQISANNFIIETFEILPSGELIRNILEQPIEGSGNAGTIDITTTNATLKDRGGITTLSSAGEGGNIQLQVDDLLTLRNNSEISATAGVEGTPGNGGQIDIDANLIVAFPNGNNDITANAFDGNGGNINITTEGIFGIEERSPNLFSNDINSSSELGLQGNIAINTPEVDPTSGLINLPASVGDVSNQISQNPCEQGVGSEFIVTGKGGLPPNVNESLNSESAQVGLIETVPSPQQKVGVNNLPSNNSIPEAVPAMGWVFNDKGEVTLTAYSNTDTEIKPSEKQHKTTCKSGIDH